MFTHDRCQCVHGRASTLQNCNVEILESQVVTIPKRNSLEDLCSGNITKSILSPVQTALGHSPQTPSHVRSCSTSSDVEWKKMLQARVRGAGVATLQQRRHSRPATARFSDGLYYALFEAGGVTATRKSAQKHTHSGMTPAYGMSSPLPLAFRKSCKLCTAIPAPIIRTPSSLSCSSASPIR